MSAQTQEGFWSWPGRQVSTSSVWLNSVGELSHTDYTGPCVSNASYFGTDLSFIQRLRGHHRVSISLTVMS